ncbi:MAG: cell wall-active antibiotics response protein LiaF [candidate division KSB1 bacterium]|nr:cell wall-active antibiotics response protein LiaF [candidate division KSB1 bacterium]
MRTCYRAYRGRSIFWGVVIILIGLLFLLDNLGYLNAGRLISQYWPLLLVALGIYIILRPSHKEGAWRDRQASGWHSSLGDISESISSDTVNLSHVFGDIWVTLDSKNFQGGRISTVFGDLKVDLQHIDVAPGEHTLYLNGMLGDIKVSVPRNVPFYVRGNIILGELKFMEEKRSGFSQTSTYKSEGYDTSDKKLNIVANQTVGEIKIW